MQFGEVKCFSEVRISNPFMHFYHAFRMEDAQVYVVNTGKSIESLCGILKIRKEWTIEGQTYRLVHEAMSLTVSENEIFFMILIGLFF